MSHPEVKGLEVSVYKIPTDFPESDGTLDWTDTTIVIVEAYAGNQCGVGYTFADIATGQLIRERLAPLLVGTDALAVPNAWLMMVRSIRNLGRPGIASMAVSAVDIALWDLKARLLNVSLINLLGKVRKRVPVYGSGGFISYSLQQLQDQLSGWAAAGMRWVKMKIGREPAADLERVRAARSAIGSTAGLFVDANGAYDRKEALLQAERFAAHGVSWFEEPVSSDDLEGLRLLRDCAPAGMNIAAGEYGYDLVYFRRMLESGAVDVLQADATRCGGFSGFMAVAALCQARSMLLSAHTAPSLHAHVCCALAPVCHVEYFHDHTRIEQMFFDGALTAQDGALAPDPSRLGLGIEFKRVDAQRYAL
ncbi:MAG TPA: enolase C-terminal domain-like protein [Bryobacteraceae bacterium]